MATSIRKQLLPLVVSEAGTVQAHTCVQKMAHRHIRSILSFGLVLCLDI